MLRSIATSQHPPLHPHGTESALVNANEALQAALQTLPADIRNDLVLRCDELPHVQIPAAAVKEIFSRLLQLVATKKVAGEKLYLHVRCAKEAGEETFPKGYALYLIRFRTNITACDGWVQENKEEFQRLFSEAAACGGRLQVNHSKNTGCLFSLSLPGKLL